MPPTPREDFINALERRAPRGRVPHFELHFFLTMEAFGRVYPTHRNYAQWMQMEEAERRLHREDIADIYLITAERYQHNAIFVHPNPWEEAEIFRLLDCLRDRSGERYFLMMHGDATYSVPSGDTMEEFATTMAEDPARLHRQASHMVDTQLEWAAKLQHHGALDGFALCSDYCFNTAPFLSPTQFGEFVTPYLARLTQAYREMGFYVIKHTDGNIMPILDQLMATQPHALHSLDPQGGVELEEVKRRFGDQVCLIGNVNCSLLDNGTPEEIKESARGALRAGMPGGGYIFSTSNCIYTGMPLQSYHTMWDVWQREGIYQEAASSTN